MSKRRLVNAIVRGLKAGAERHALRFGETEHSGDLARWESDLRRAGARVISSRIMRDRYETGEIQVEIVDMADFLQRFRRTTAYLLWDRSQRRKLEGAM